MVVKVIFGFKKFLKSLFAWSFTVKEILLFSGEKISDSSKIIETFNIMAFELVWKCLTHPNQEVSSSIPPATLAGTVNTIVSVSE